ncbi:hypothetical protein Hanom_Chr01g00078951 [Helianthus anomalus]
MKNFVCSKILYSKPAGVAQLATNTHLLPRGTGFNSWGKHSTLKRRLGKGIYCQAQDCQVAVWEGLSPLRSGVPCITLFFFKILYSMFR